MLTKEIFIIGSGIAGLATAYYLTRQNPSLADQILLIEKGERIGGKIHSHRTTDGYVIELGAGRYQPEQHPLLDALIHDFQSDCQFFPCTVRYSFNQTTDVKWRAFIDHSLFILKRAKQHFTSFIEGCQHLLGKANGYQFCLLMGYDALLNPKMSWQLGLSVCLDHPERPGAQQWFFPKLGFQTLLLSMQNALRDRGCTIVPHCELLSVEKGHNAFELTCSRLPSARVQKLIFTGPLHGKQALFQMSDKLQTLFTEEKVDVPLFKAFLSYPNRWWESLGLQGSCLILPPPVCKVYFPRECNYLFVYNDSESAIHWSSTDSIKESLHAHFARALNKERSWFPQVTEEVKQFWPCGITYWKGAISDKYQEIGFLQDNRMYYVSDLFTPLPGWIEGSLQSAKKTAKAISIG